MLSYLMQGYIEFEISEGEHDRTRQLYERLLDRTKHLKVWVSFAKFEAAVPLEEEAVAQEEGREPDMAKAAGQAEERARRTRGMQLVIFFYFPNFVLEYEER